MSGWVQKRLRSLGNRSGGSLGCPRRCLRGISRTLGCVLGADGGDWEVGVPLFDELPMEDWAA